MRPDFADIELVLDRGVTNAPKIELQFAPSQSYKVQTIMKAIRKAVDVSCKKWCCLPSLTRSSPLARLALVARILPGGPRQCRARQD
jgi:hypothetical protein